MGRALGSKTPPLSDEARKAQERGHRASRGRQIRFRRGRYASAAVVKAALEVSVGDYLGVLDKIVMDDAQDARVRSDAAKYLIDRVAGKPTEKQQIETLPVTFQAPSDEQFEELVTRVTGGTPGVEPEGPGGASSDPDRPRAVN